MIGNMPPKGVSLSDFIATFCHACCGFLCLWIRNTKVSENADMAKNLGNKMLLRNL